MSHSSQKDVNDIGVAPNNIEWNNKTGNNNDEDKYLFYCIIEVYKYETSQDEITTGLQNPINEIQKICEDFNIKYENDCTFIDYNEAKKIGLSTFMLWGTLDSLYKFFDDNNIKGASIYFKQNKDKAGIYLCVDIKRKIGYLVVWPGNQSYQYSRIDEPINNILLTLISYGFFLSENSILSLSKNDMKNFDLNGYEILRDKNSEIYETERSKIIFNKNLEKKFILKEKKSL